MYCVRASTKGDKPRSAHAKSCRNKLGVGICSLKSRVSKRMRSIRSRSDACNTTTISFQVTWKRMASENPHERSLDGRGKHMKEGGWQREVMLKKLGKRKATSTKLDRSKPH